MKFFKFLLQILAMGLCFVAGMTYEKNLLLKIAPNGEIDVNSVGIKNDDIIIDNTTPTERQEVIDEEFNFDNSNNNVIVNDNTTFDNNNNDVGFDNNQPQDSIGQQVEESVVNDQTIIINDIEVINDKVEGNDTVIQPEQLPNNEN